MYSSPPPSAVRATLAVSVAILGAALTIFVRVPWEGLSLCVFFISTGLAALVAPPVSWPRGWPLALGLLFVAATLTAQLPVGTFGSEPQWRASFPPNSLVNLGDSLAAMPPLAFWWSMMLAGTWLAMAILLSVPLEGRTLAGVLHVVSGAVALYAVASILDWQGLFSRVGAGDGVFGLLPNRNHTATLLFVGAIVAFGLMQWELAHGRPVAAAFAALCGAPCLAALLFFSISRAGVVFLLIGFFLWAAGAARTVANRRVLAVTVAVLVLFLGGLFFLGGSEVQERLGRLSQSLVATDNPGQGGQAIDFRQQVFKDTLRMIGDAPLTGSGLGHFEPVFSHYREASLRAAGVLHPESDWLFVAAESGWPAVAVLVALAGWYLVTIWRVRGVGGDGMLRWTVASAIAAAALHALVDTPWHGPAPGFFLLATAAVVVPAGRGPVRLRGALRAIQIVAGLALLAFGVGLLAQTRSERPPLPLRWAAYSAELKALGVDRRHDDGVVVGKEAVRDFPLNYQAYYWYANFLRTFLGTEGEMAEALTIGRYVQPVLPRVSSEQALVWAGIDPREEAAARLDAIRRAARIDLVEQRPELDSAGGEIQVAIAAAKDRLDVQGMIGQGLLDEPILLAYWFRVADQAACSEMLPRVPDVRAWLEPVPERIRREVLDRLILLPDPSLAVSYMELHGGAPPGRYWRTLARLRAANGDQAGAVSLVATACQVPLETRGRGLNDFGRQLADLEAQGNDVAVRRLLSEASAPDQKDTDKLAVAMAWFAAAGDWENSWKAASRLASLTKIED